MHSRKQPAASSRDSRNRPLQSDLIKTSHKSPTKFEERPYLSWLWANYTWKHLHWKGRAPVVAQKHLGEEAGSQGKTWTCWLGFHSTTSQSPAVPDMQPAQLTQGLQHLSFPLKAPPQAKSTIPSLCFPHLGTHCLELGESLQNHSREEPRYQFMLSSSPYKSDLLLLLLLVRSLQF